MAVLASGLVPELGTTAFAGALRAPKVVAQWDSLNSLLAPLTHHQGEVLFAGNRSLGRIDPAAEGLVWNVEHGVTAGAVFRPRAGGDVVIAGGLNALGAWSWASGQPTWHHKAAIQIGVPWVTPKASYVGDGHHLLAIDNTQGTILWRYAGTPDTLTSYAPTVSGSTVMFAPGNGWLYALSTVDGSVQWKLNRSHEWQYLRQLYVSDGVLVAGSYKELLYGISVADGKVLWTFNAGNFINSHHVAADTAYLWSPTGWVYAIDIQNGNVRWRHQTTNYGQSANNWAPLMSELATYGENLYALDMRNVLHVLNKSSGEEIHRVAFAHALRPVVLPLPDQQAFVATHQGLVQRVQY
jgi:outer membrane protein assembly factor BamB